MATTPSVITQMVNDPDFGKMPLEEQQKALAAHDPDFGRMGQADITRFIAAQKTPATPYADAAKLAAQPTQFEQQRSPGQQQGFVGSAIDAIRGMVPSWQSVARRAALGGLDPVSDLQKIQQMGAATQTMRDPRAKIVAALGPLAGVNPTAMQQSAERGDTGAVAAQAAVPAATTLLGYGVAKGAGPLSDWISSSKSAGAELLQRASAKAGNAPVKISPQTDSIVEEITKEAKLGGPAVPKVISDFLERVGPTTKASPYADEPLTYDEARRLQSNASSMSAAERMAMKGRMGGLIKQFANSFSKDVQAAADSAGVGEEHAMGMKEYAMAAARDRMLEEVKNTAIPAIAKGALGAATGAGSAYALYKILKGERR